MHGLGLAVDEPGAVQLAQNGEDAARTVHVSRWCCDERRHLANVRHLARQTIDVGHGEIHARRFCHRQNVQYGVGRAPMAMSSVMAFSKACKVAMLRGSTSSLPCW